jgi:phosphopantetheine adenylyltransferase
MTKIIRAVFLVLIFATVTSCEIFSTIVPVPLGHEQPSKEELDELKRLIGLSKEEVIEKVGTPKEHVFLDGQQYFIYRSIAKKYSGTVHIVYPIPVPLADKEETGTAIQCLMIRIGSDNVAQEYHLKYLDSSDLRAWCLDMFFSESEIEHATIEIEELNELLGLTKVEVITKVGTPSEYVFLDGQHYFIYRSLVNKNSDLVGIVFPIPLPPESQERATGEVNQCLMIRIGSDNLAQEYHLEYLDSSDLRAWCLDMFFSESELEHATIVIYQAPLDAPVTIDIRPQSYSNHVDPASNEDMSVAILSTKFFDARSVKPSSVAFGPAQAPISSYQAWRDVDVNDDGKRDRVFFFRISETGIACGDKRTTLTGETFEGYPISGSDWVMTVNCD